MKRRMRQLTVLLAATVVASLGPVVPVMHGARFPEARIFFEYNFTANDLGVHVALDAEDWKSVKIVHPDGRTIFNVVGKGGFGNLGMTELFFEGAEPSLDEFPLEELLALFPEDRYTFIGMTVDGHQLTSRPTLSHAIPAGPDVSSAVSGRTVVISWKEVTGTHAGFPDRPITITGYQVIAGSFQVTLPRTARSLTLPTEFVDSLASGTYPFEVLAIEVSGNQSITESAFVIP